MIALHGTTWDHPRGRGPVEGLVRLYEATHPGRTIVWEARSLQAFADCPLERLVGEYDLVVVDHPHIPSAAEQGLLRPLDGAGYEAELAVLSCQSVGSSHASYAHKGRQYGLAIDAAAQVAAYRPDVIPDPPTSWDGVRALLDRGLVLWPGKPVDAMSSFLTLLSAKGRPICSDDNSFVEESSALEVLEQLHELADRVPSTCLEEDPVEIAERLVDGDDWAYAPLLFGYSNYSRRGFRSKRLNYVDAPLTESGFAGSCLGGAGIAVSSSSPNGPDAVEFAFWLASAEVQAGSYYFHGGQPANAVAWDDAAVNEDCRDFFKATRRTLEGASLRPRVKWWVKFQDYVGVLVNAALKREISDEGCLKRLAAEYERLAAQQVLDA
jgi:multiple sugar transport system substrate-binding protein